MRRHCRPPAPAPPARSKKSGKSTKKTGDRVRGCARAGHRARASCRRRRVRRRAATAACRSPRRPQVRRRRRIETFSSYVYKVLKQVHPGAWPRRAPRLIAARHRRTQPAARATLAAAARAPRAETGISKKAMSIMNSFVVS
jgi:hypothetical protein